MCELGITWFVYEIQPRFLDQTTWFPPYLVYCQLKEGTSSLDSPVIGYGFRSLNLKWKDRCDIVGSPESGSEIFTAKRTGLDKRKWLHSVSGMLC